MLLLPVFFPFCASAVSTFNCRNVDALLIPPPPPHTHTNRLIVRCHDYVKRHPDPPRPVPTPDVDAPVLPPAISCPWPVQPEDQPAWSHVRQRGGSADHPHPAHGLHVADDTLLQRQLDQHPGWRVRRRALQLGPALLPGRPHQRSLPSSSLTVPSTTTAAAPSALTPSALAPSSPPSLPGLHDNVPQLWRR